MLRPSIVTDEISADFATAVELGTSWGIHDFELRGYGENRVPLLSDYQKTRVREVLDAYDARLVAISPGLFKFPFPASSRNMFPVAAIDHAIFQDWQHGRNLLDFHLNELLPHAIDFAHEFDVRTIVSFGFSRGTVKGHLPPDELVETLHQAAERISAADLNLAIEVEDGFWADTGEHTAALLAAVNHPALRVNWDPGNAFQAGDSPFPEGYALIRDKVAHVHFKDIVKRADGSYEYRVEGAIDWTGQIRALAEDGYDGFISVETHMSPQVASARAATRRLLRLIETATAD